MITSRMALRSLSHGAMVQTLRARKAAQVSSRRATVPARTYIICTTPRSGSWLLSDGLASTGVAGRPREWFNPLQEQQICARWRMSHDSDLGLLRYLAVVRAQSTTPNGVSGIKLHYYQFAGLADKFAVFPGCSGLTFKVRRPEIMSLYFPAFARSRMCVIRFASVGTKRTDAAATMINAAIAISDRLRVITSATVIMPAPYAIRPVSELLAIMPHGITIAAIHASAGQFDSAWNRYAARFLQKNPGLTAPVGPHHSYGARLASREHIRRFHDELNALAQHP